MLKKLTVLVVLGLLVFSSLAFGSSNELKVAIWTEYYNPAIFSNFESTYGVKVSITHYDTYEEMFGHLSTHDVIITGELVVPAMIKDDLLEPLNKSQIPNFKNLDPLFKGLSFDLENKYTMPYHYIYVGLVYHKERVDIKDVSLQNYFEAPAKFKGRLTTFPEQRFMVGFGMMYIGQSMNNLDQGNLDLVKMLLENLKDNLAESGKNINRGVLEPYFELLRGDADIAISYAAQSTKRVLNAENEIGIVLPAEGAIIGTDNLMIPKNSKNKELAHKFINYLYEPEVAALSVDFLGNPIPVLGARELIKPELANNPEIYPPSQVTRNFQFIEPMTEEQLAIYSKIWKEVFGSY